MVRILFFASLRELVGNPEIEFPLRGKTQVSDLYQMLRVKYPKLLESPRNLLVSVNEEFADWESQVRPGDEIAFFPPVSGGIS